MRKQRVLSRTAASLLLAAAGALSMLLACSAPFAATAVAAAGAPPASKKAPARAAASTAGTDPATAEAKKGIQAAYDKMNEAMRLQDAEATAAFYDDALITTLPDGKTFNKQQTLSMAKQLMQGADSISISGSMKSFKLLKKDEEAVTVYKVFSKIEMPHPQTQQRATLFVETTSEDTWIKKGKDWLMKRSRGLAGKTKFVPQP